MSQSIQNENIFKEEENNYINNDENINKQKKQNWASIEGGKDFLDIRENINDVQMYNGVHQESPKQLESNSGDIGDVQYFTKILKFSNNGLNNGSYIYDKNNQNINPYQDNKKDEPNNIKENNQKIYIKKEKEVFNSQFSIQSDENERTINQAIYNSLINKPNDENIIHNNDDLNNTSGSIIIIDNNDYCHFSNKNSCSLNEIKKNDNINNEKNDNNSNSENNDNDNNINANNKNNENNIYNENNDNNYNNVNKDRKYNLPSSNNLNIININPYNNDPVSNLKENNNSSINNEIVLYNPYKNDNYNQNEIENNINNNINNNNNNKYIIKNSSINIHVSELEKNNSIASHNISTEQQIIQSQPLKYDPIISNESNAQPNPEVNKNIVSQSEKTIIKIKNNINSENSKNQKVSKHILDRYKTVSKTGLSYEGDSYINAVLQSLGHVRPFASYFLNPKNQEFIKSKPKSMPLSYVTYRLFEHLYPYPETNAIEIYSPESYLQILSFLKSPYGKQRSNPNDFLIYILNTLHDELNSKKGNEQILRMPYNFYYSQNNVIQNGIRNFINNNKSKISDVVSWFQLNESYCSNCGRSTFNFNSFNIYDLDIKNTYEYFLNDEKNYIDISDCLSYGSMPKKFKSYCYNCKNRVIISRQSRIYSSPNVFIFLLDRGIEFNENYIHIPFKVEEKINLTNFIIKENSPVHYGLTGIVSFNRQEQKYVSYCQSPIDSNWYWYNDEKVNLVFCQDILNNKNDNEIPCILYYKTI